MSHKILIFSTAYYPFVGGAEVAVKEITDRAGDFGFDMITARMDRKLPKFERIGAVNVHRIGLGVPVVDKCYLAFCGHCFAGKLHKKNRYSAIWSIMASYGGFSALSFKKRNLDIPFLLTIQEGDDPEYIKKRVGIFKKRFRDIFIRADHIQCISKFLANWAKENGATSTIEVVPNGVNLNKFKHQTSSLKNKDEKILITTSRLVKKNAVGDIIEAMRFLPKNVKLLILGDGLLRKNLKSQISNLKLESRVEMLGEISHGELPKYLASADIFIRPSLSEGLGNAFLEAMAVGLPVIGTPVGGIPDFLKDGETGLFCEVNNPESIAEKIEEILGNNILRENIIKNGVQLARTEYNWDIVSKKMNNIFNKICEF